MDIRPTNPKKISVKKHVIRLLHTKQSTHWSHNVSNWNTQYSIIIMDSLTSKHQKLYDFKIQLYPMKWADYIILH